MYGKLQFSLENYGEFAPFSVIKRNIYHLYNKCKRPEGIMFIEIRHAEG